VSTTCNKRQLASGISIVAIAASLSVATPAYAQVDFGTISGRVEGAAAGTQVVAVDTHTGQRTVGTVNAQGNYEIFGLRPSTYTVTVQGKPAQSTTVLIGQTSNVDFLQARTATGAIVVTGRRTAQPVQAQTVATNITPAQIENLPQNSRNFLSFAQLAPGVQLVNPSGAQQLQVGALSPSNSNILLDGMTFKNPINHGGMFGQNFGSFGNPFPQIAIQEYQLETQNFGAEIGQSAAAVLTAITKTGGNQFHGSAFIEYQPKSFISKPHFQSGPKQDYNRKQFGGDLGGPIIPGKLSFYVAFEGTNQKLPALTFNVNSSVPQNIVAQVNGSIPQDFKQRLYFGKLTWFATPDDTVNVMGYLRRQSNLSDFGGNAVQSHGRLLQTEQDRYQAQWRHSAGNFLNFLNIAYDKANQGTPNLTQGPEYILTGGQDTGSRLVLMGANSFQQNDVEKSWVIKDDATLRRGPHTFKAGGQITFYDLSRTENANFNGTYFVANPCPSAPATTVCPVSSFDITTAAPFAGQINIAPSPTVSGKDTQIGLYIQDEWKPDIHWTVNAGLRWDFESNANNNHYVTPAAIATALRSYQGWAARGIDPEDYISNGHNRKPFYGAFQPRLGVSYDVHGDRDVVIFGGAGRYYDRPLFIEGVLETLQNSNVNLTVNLPGCNTASPPAYCHDVNALRTYAASLGYTGGSVWVLPNKVKMPYSDQFDIGIRKRFGQIQTSLTFSHVESHNIFLYERANFYSNGWMTRYLVKDAAGNVIGCTNGGDQWIQDQISPVNYPACPAMNGDLTGFHGKLNRGANNGRARLDAIYIQIEKPFTDTSTWGFTQALTLQRARTNVGQDFYGDEMFNGPYLDTYGWNYVPNVEKWRSVTSANWRAPFGITLSGVLTLSSGPAFGHLVAPWTGGQPAPDNACCGPANLAGVYFPHKTFGYKRLDMRVAKTFKMPWGHGHEATVDFQAFNVFNWLNRTYSAWGSGGGEPPPLVENGQVANDQRQFQVGLKYKF
jgi:outer membrane receptor for ferrienterochelin and colicin